MATMVVIAGLLAALWEYSLFFNYARTGARKPCSPYGYHNMRTIALQRIHRREDSAIPDMPELGRLYVIWDEVHERERCQACKFERTATRRENYRQRRIPPPT